MSTSTRTREPSLLPEPLRSAQSSLKPLLLELPPRIETPTGAWATLEQMQIAKRDSGLRERSAHIHVAPVPGVTVELFEQLSPAGAAIVAQHLLTLLPRDLDQALGAHFTRLTGGVLIFVNGTVRDPIVIEHTSDLPSLSADRYRSTLIILEPGASCTIIERHIGSAGLASHTVEMFLSEGARLTYADFQEMRPGARAASVEPCIVVRKAAHLARDAWLISFEASASRGTVYSRLHTTLAGEQAQLQAYSLFLGERQDRIDAGASVDHQAPRTASDLCTRGVLAGMARAIYEGVLRIGALAAKSRAFQDEGCLLLSREAQMRASPQLFIDNNDVTCSHASTTSRPDPERLFYCRSRGLSFADARRLVVNGSLLSLLARFDDQDRVVLEPLIEPLVDAYLAQEQEGTHP